MRNNIYYRKCDNTLSDAVKMASYSKEKYDWPGLKETVERVCRQIFGSMFHEVAPLRGDGNHIVFIVRYGDELREKGILSAGTGL